jgi:hypothetical protein
VALSFDHSTGEMILYKDGLSVDSATLSAGDLDVTDATISVGSIGAASGFMWAGALDDVRIYNHALSPEQIASLYSTGRDVVVSEETNAGEQWQCEVTPFSATETGSTSVSNMLTIQDAGSITIAKETNPDGGMGFDFVGDLGALTLDDDENLVFSGLLPGDYDATEIVPTGWALAGVVCIGGDADPITDGVTIHLDSGENISCTFTNDEYACVGNVDCDDGQYCNGAETCESNVCASGTPPCISLSYCDEVQDVCLCGEIPASTSGGNTPLLVTKGPGSRITLTWDASCVATDTDFAIYEGQIGDFAGHGQKECSTEGATMMSVSPAAGDSYYLVVPRNTMREGSYGSDSQGAERPPAAMPCVPQALGSCTGATGSISVLKSTAPAGGTEFERLSHERHKTIGATSQPSVSPQSLQAPSSSGATVPHAGQATPPSCGETAFG